MKKIATLKKRSDFLRASESNNKVATKSLVLQAIVRDIESVGLDSSRFGFTVSGKIGNAVIRNKVKRKLRSALLRVLEKNTYIDAKKDYVIIARKDVLKKDFDEIVKDLGYAFRKVK